MKPYASLQDVREDLYGFSRKFPANVPRMSLREGLSGTSPPWNIIHHIFLNQTLSTCRQLDVGIASAFLIICCITRNCSRKFSVED